MSHYNLTYSTMFQPPEELHASFEQALVRARARMGQDHALFIDGVDAFTQARLEAYSPIDTRRLLGRYSCAGTAEVDAAVAAAGRAFPAWRRTPMAERLALARRIADLVEERVYDIAATLSIEVGKNRMEALGEAQEVADFFRLYAADFEGNHGFVRDLPDDPVAGYRSRNRSVLKPYGVWAVISPYNFPFALSGGPVAAALVTGNTVVLKPAADTSWSVRLLADCIRDAGCPAGVFQFVSGNGAGAGQALVSHPRVAGITFTGSYETGMAIYRSVAAGPYPRPTVLEMGGKNAAIVTARADLDRAALGITRSAFGLTGQKCSALSRVYVEDAVADRLLEALQAQARALCVGDPTLRAVQMGPVGNARAAAQYERYSERLRADTRVLAGAERLREGELAHGHYCAPTLVESAPDHPLMREEMFSPILMVARVRDREQALQAANSVDLGLTAGVFGSEDDVGWFLDGIEAGVTYCNRPQGATTGAWPGYQPFGGWKGSGSTGKGIASAYYLPLYLREQSQTIVD